MARVLETLGELSRVAGLSLREHIQDILPLVIEALNDASNSKKAVAITTLGKVSDASTQCSFLASPGMITQCKQSQLGTLLPE